MANLERYNYKVDYIITHACGERALAYLNSKLRFGIGIGEKARAKEVNLLSNFEDKVEFRQWYFGHYHVDAQLGDKYTVLLHDIVKLGDSHGDDY